MAWGDDRSYTQRGESLFMEMSEDEEYCWIRYQPGGLGAMTEAIHREVNYDLWR